jgi:hypothetical protein
VVCGTRSLKLGSTGRIDGQRRWDSECAEETRSGEDSPRYETAYRNARLPYLSSETSSPTGRRVVGPYLPIGQPRGITAQGVTFHGRPRARLAKSLLHSGAVIRAAPNPAARAASKRFCTAG